MEDNKKKYLEEMEELNREQVIDYCFTKYYEFKDKDLFLADFFFFYIAKIMKNNMLGSTTRNLSKITSREKNEIMDYTYDCVYNGADIFKKPLENIFGEILDMNTENPNISPYLGLIRDVKNTVYKNEEKFTRPK